MLLLSPKAKGNNWDARSGALKTSNSSMLKCEISAEMATVTSRE